MEKKIIVCDTCGNTIPDPTDACQVIVTCPKTIKGTAWKADICKDCYKANNIASTMNMAVATLFRV